MKMQDFGKVRQLMEDRAELCRQYNLVESDTGSGQSLGVTINGKYQDHVMVAAVRPQVLFVLTTRINNIDADLERLGVEV